MEEKSKKKVEATKVVETTKKPKSKKPRRKKPKAKKRDWSKLRLMVLNEEGKYEIMEVPSSLDKDYIQTFGLMTTRTKQELQTWLDSKNVL